jgi:uncharacterized membrane protein
MPGGNIDSGLLQYSELFRALPFKPQKKVTRQEMHRAQDIRWTRSEVFQESPAAGYYLPLIYAPAAVGLHTGLILDLTVHKSYRLARFTSLLFIAATLIIAFRIFPTNPLTLAFLALPMTLFQVASPTLDGVSTALAVFAISAFMRIFRDGASSPSWIFYLMAFTCILVAGSRIQLLTLMPLLMCAAYWTRNKKHLLISFLSLMVVLGWSVFAAKTTTDVSQSVTGAPTEELISFYLANPTRFLNLIYDTLTYDTMFQGYSRQFIGILGWLDTRFGWRYYSFFGYLTLLIAFTSVSLRNIKKDWQPRVLLCTMALASVLIVFFALLITWNPHPAQVIEGVQGRYFIVPSIMVAYALSGLSGPTQELRRSIAAILLAIFILVSYTGTAELLVDRYFLQASTMHKSEQSSTINRRHDVTATYSIGYHQERS